MTRIARYLLRRERALSGEGQPAILPSVKSAGQIVHILITQLAQRSRCEQRTGAGSALEDHGRLVVGHLFFDPQFEKTARNSNRLRNMTLTPFVALAHINQDGAG